MDQELMMKLEMTHRQSQEIEEKAGIIDKQINELKVFEQSLIGLKDTEEKEMLASLGKGVFVKSDIKDKELFVEVGAGYLVKKSPEETATVLNGQVARLGEMKMQLEMELERVNGELQQMMGELEKKEEK
jgi:prefoldin alpha subunit